MSNEVSGGTVKPDTDQPDRHDAPAAAPPLLVLIAGDDDLVCIDDTCLPPDVAR